MSRSTVGPGARNVPAHTAIHPACRAPDTARGETRFYGSGFPAVAHFGGLDETVSFRRERIRRWFRRRRAARALEIEGPHAKRAPSRLTVQVACEGARVIGSSRLLVECRR